MADRYRGRGDHYHYTECINTPASGGGFATQTTSEASAPCTSTGSTAPDSLRPRYQHDLLDPPLGQASSRQFKNIISPLQRKSGHLDIKHIECLLQHSQLRECMGVL